MKPQLSKYLGILLFLTVIGGGLAIQCYQCDSNEDKSCPSNHPFDEHLNALVDCSSFEAKVPGTFCMKIQQQSPGWRAWKKVTRRCGSRSDTGVAWGCRWLYEENGVWKEICYCEDRDGCNTSSIITSSPLLVSTLGLCSLLAMLLWHYAS